MKRPSSQDLIFHTLDLIAARQLAEETGTADDYKEYCPAWSKGLIDPKLDARTAVAQLDEPNLANPVALIGYRLPDLVPDDSLSAPEALTKFVELFEETNL